MEIRPFPAGSSAKFSLNIMIASVREEYPEPGFKNAIAPLNKGI
ncbi:hypothetical protein HME9302_02356 [Alteripontixanthobacter maritimus]|uniref:Uncharacterized protein n=1 Tax=Alteripontixanthobacter maritimus TaxID=2161824 RepID=A0A369QD22_9SPHN|nr:hypothetical protein [Alteripontixanthobacter maritimus]RDC61137.1 hypothetical protein HME9302_02356 [Alteripontixanthobacter maritimus]